MDAEFDPQSEELPFAEVLKALQDEEHPFAARYLYRLSALEADEIVQLRAVWGGLTAQRRLGVLEDLELVAEGNTMMHFDAVNRLGLGDEDPRIRVTAIRALWSSEQARLAPEFVRLLESDPDTNVRAQAAAGLGRFVYLGEVGKLPPETLKRVEDVLLEQLNSDVDPFIQQRTLESLGYSSRPEITEFIESAFEGGEEEWVVSALFAMGRSADDRWAPVVIQSLNDPNREISREAAKAAGELELSEARPGLFDLLQAEESEVRLAAAWALSQIGGNGIADVIEELIERSDDEDEIDLLENTLENLAFTQEMDELNILDFTPEDLEELSKPDRDDSDPEDDE